MEAHITYNQKMAMAQDSIDWGALAGGAAGAKMVEIAFAYFKNLRKRKNAASNSIEETKKIYQALQDIPNHQCNHRAVIVAHNGGKLLNTRTHKFLSVLYESYNNPFKGMADDIVNWRIDEACAMLLSDMVRVAEAHIYPTDLEDGKLKDLYESIDVRYAYWQYIGEDGSNLYFASFLSDIQLT